jgi:rhodanese-related sulfurtransferase
MRLLTIALLVALSAPCAAGAEHTTDTLDDVKGKLAENEAVLVDVREKREWDRGHLAGAELLPISELNKLARDPEAEQKLAKRLPKDRIVYCHCAKGVRAAMAADVFRKWGYDVRPLKPGFEELREAGFSIAQPAAAKKP